jgi:hypothetical protein
MMPQPYLDTRDRGLDLDSHADMAVLGSNCFVFEENGKTVNVFSYDPELSSMARNVISGSCFAYDDPCSGRVILLIVHQGLHIPHLGYSLIQPFQMRENDVIVNDRPKFQTRSPTEDDHCVIVTRDDLMTYSMPLLLRGTTSFLDVQRPTDNDIHDNDLERFELTYQSPDWEPGADCFSTMEDCLELETAACPSTGDRSTVLAVNRAEVDVTFAISTYEHELSQGNAILTGISSVYCNDLSAQAMQEERTYTMDGSVC